MSDDSTTLRLDWRGKPGAATGVCAAKINGSPAFYVKKIDRTIPEERDAFVKECLGKRPGLERTILEEQMDYVAADSVREDDSVENEKIGQGQRVAKLADGADLFHFGQTAYATIAIPDASGGSRPETWPITSEGFRSWLRASFHKSYRTPPTAAAVQDAIGALEGVAVFQRPERKVAVRMAEHEGAIYLDLADDHRSIVRIGPDGWTLTHDSPVKFLRKKGQMAIPTPVRGGKFDRLRALFNASDKDWMLMQAWLIGALHPHGPYPLLSVNGEQGSAKSTACKMLRSLIDPNNAPLRAQPRDERDLMIQATNSLVCGFDNLSGMPQWLSDALCRLSTGGGFSTRMLHSDDVEMLFDAKRPIVFNGIEEDAEKHDLNDRTIQITLSPIPKTSRRTEKQIWSEFRLAAPEALGALLDAVSCALAHVSAVELNELPRMADFAQWVVAAAPSMGWTQEQFIDAYAGIRDDANVVAMERSPLAQAIVQLLSKCGVWTGTTAELLDALERVIDERARTRKGWPDTVSKAAAQLRRIAPVLRQNGFNVEWLERTKRSRPVRITRICEPCETTVTPVTPSPEEIDDLPF